MTSQVVHKRRQPLRHMKDYVSFVSCHLARRMHLQHFSHRCHGFNSHGIGLNLTEGNPFVSVYIEDIMIFSRTLEDHMGQVEMVLKRLAEVNMK